MAILVAENCPNQTTTFASSSACEEIDLFWLNSNMTDLHGPRFIDPEQKGAITYLGYSSFP